MNTILFDLDGVLIDSKDNHFLALNESLKHFFPKKVISYEEHLKTYDGLSTMQKLNILNIDEEFHESINNLKQEKTIEILDKTIKVREDFVKMFRDLKEKKFNIAVCSNSVRRTVEIVLYKLGIENFVDIFFGNEDVQNPKPSPDIYTKAIEYFKVKPEQCLVLEDNEKGIKAAVGAGCYYCKIENSYDLTLEKIYNNLYNIYNKSS